MKSDYVGAVDFLKWNMKDIVLTMYKCWRAGTHDAGKVAGQVLWVRFQGLLVFELTVAKTRTNNRTAPSGSDFTSAVTNMICRTTESDIKEHPRYMQEKRRPSCCWRRDSPHPNLS